MKPILLPLALFLCALVGAGAAETFYVGTYSRGDSKGIYQYEFDPGTGAVKDLGLAVTTKDPSYLALHPSKKFIYAVNESSPGGVSAFAVEADGKLKELNRESALGKGTTHLSLDREAKNVLAANYDSGSVVVLPIKPDGSLGKSTGFVQHTGPPTPHAHCANVDETNRRALVCDLGLDKLFLYKFDAAAGKLDPGTPPFVNVTPGSGPRHLVFGPHGRVYVLGEHKSMITVFEPDGNSLKPVESISTLPAGFTGESHSAEIVLHPNGRFLYASNRGPKTNSIASFAVESDGKLKALGHTSSGGNWPRFIGIHPSGKWLLATNEKSGNVVVFSLNESTGELKATGVEMKRADAVCVLFMGDGK